MTVSPQLIQLVGGVQFSLHEAFLFYGSRVLSVVTKDERFADLQPPFCLLNSSLRYFE